MSRGECGGRPRAGIWTAGQTFAGRQGGALKDAIAGLLKPVHALAIVLVALRRPTLERPTGAIGSVRPAAAEKG
jgi:hypothetical protein